MSQKPILEYNGAGTLVAANLYGSGIDESSLRGRAEMDGQAGEGNRQAERERTSQILMRSDYTISPTRVLFYQDDHEGSITRLTSATGAVMESYRYDAFGAPTIKDETGSVVTTSVYKNRFLFTGREYAEKFGIYEYRNRAYHPTLGRFTSEDPKGYDAGDYNLFRYCGNDPLDKTDPMGLDVTFDKQEFRISHVEALTRGVHQQYFREHPILMAQVHAQSTGASQTSNHGQAAQPRDNGLPKKFVPTDRRTEKHEGPLVDGHRKYLWKAVTATGKPVTDFNMTNHERVLRGGAVAATGPRQMSSDAVMSDTVGYSGRLPGKLSTFTGDRVFIMGNTVRAYGVESRMTTEFLDVISFKNGRTVEVSSKAIEPGHPLYVPQ